MAGEARITCGWCGKATLDVASCTSCGRDPRLAWLHRGQEPPQVTAAAGRPSLDAAEIRELYTNAREAIESRGRRPTEDAIAEELDRSPRTVREWRKRFGLE